jgi:ABC-type transport system involved in cytochrome bd biosynthesis fused ATPase/permease subunit
VLNEGRIVDRGTHEELLETSPTYAHLWEMQMHLQTQESGLTPVAAGEVEARP